MVLDRADWHYDGDFPEDLPSENGGTHIGMFLAWLILNDLESDRQDRSSSDAITEVRARRITGRDFLFKELDEKLDEDDLTKMGAAFAVFYYSGTDGYGKYFSDYERALGSDFPTIYHVEDTWENYDKIEPFISLAYEQWRNSLEDD